jgi:PHD/YefM family antitoxin component YafN of YafNO toxin-antitoxin module
MLTVNPQYITDETGKKLSVVISISEFNSLMEELDELEDIRLYDEAKAANEPSIPIEDAFKMLDEKRRLQN